jgi:hypothetical protein
MSTRKADRKSKKHTRKQSGSKRAPTAWTKLVSSVYNELKAKNPNAKLKDAMIVASKRNKQNKH